MKKSLKILTLVLSLALICGALVVAAFAGDTEVAGIAVVKSTDFTGSTFADNTSSTIVNGFSWNDVSVGNYGVKTDDNGNSYFYWDGTPTGVAGFNRYIAATVSSINPKNYNKETGTHTQAGTLDVYDHVVEMDVFAPTGAYETASASFIKVMVFGWGPDFANGSRGSYCSNLNVELKLTTDADGVSWVNWGGKSVALEADSWSHITVAITSERIADTVNGDYLSFNAAIWVNDTLAIYKEGYGTTLDPLVGTSAKGYDQLTSYVLGEIRIQPQSSNKANTTADMSMAVDNIVIQQITKETYNGNLYDVIEEGGKASTWESNNYDRTKTPYGTTVVTNGDTEYDNLQYAIDCANEGDELVLQKDTVSRVIVDKDLYIVKNGFAVAGGVEGAKGYGVSEDDEGYQIEQAAGIEVEWGACECGLDICDETHPGGIVTEVNIGGNIFNSYEKDMNWSYTSADGLTIIKLIGWVDEYGNAYDETSVMTVELADECGGYLMLTPQYAKETPAYEFKQSGKTVYGMADQMSLKDAIGKADAGTTFKILSDLAFIDGANIGISKNLTVDFGGKTIVSITKGSKVNLFNVGSVEVTFMTSTPGAVIMHGHDQGVANAKESFRGLAIFGATGSNAIVRINGEGLTTYSTVVCHTQTGGGINGGFYIDGGTYIQPSSIGDNGGMFQFSTFKFFEMKNATVHTTTRTAFAFWGNHYQEAPEEKVVANIDNCVIVAPNIAQASFDMLEVNFTNTVLAGNLNLSLCQAKSSWYTSRENVPGGTWNIGEGCTLKAGITIKTSVQDCTIGFAEGYVAESYSATETYTFQYNTFSTGDLAATKVLGDPTEVTVTLDKKVVKYVAPITINWVDSHGNPIGTTTATPGYVAVAPVVAVEGNSWVMAQYITWQNHEGVAGEALVPADAQDGYTFKLVEGSAATYVAGKVPVYINYDLVLHFQLNIYIPANAPAGVTNVKYIRTDSAERSFRNAGNVVNGENMLVGSEWPGADGADNHIAIAAVVFEYEGQTVTYTVPNFNIGEYAKYIFENDYTTEMKQAVLSTINYVKAANEYKNQTPTASLTEAIALAAECGVAIENVAVDTTVTGDYSAIAQYVASAQIVYINSGVSLQLAKTQAAIDEGVAVFFNGSSPKISAQYAVSGNNWFWTNTRAYEFDDAVTIEVYKNCEVASNGKPVYGTGELVASCEYSAVAYAAAMWNELGDADKNLIVATLTMAKYTDAIADNYK